MGRKIVKNLKIVLLLLIFLTSLIGLYFVLSPEVYYEAAKDKRNIDFEHEDNQKTYAQNKLLIPSIGVNTDIGLSPSALETGGWIEKTNQEGSPLVIAIHRFGLNTLTPKQKTEQTLYHVDKLHQGDEVYIIWNNEKFEYRITRISTAKNNPSIKDSELLIYTCKFWNSAERVFVLAERI